MFDQDQPEGQDALDDGLLAFPPTPDYLQLHATSDEGGSGEETAWWQGLQSLLRSRYIGCLTQLLEASDPRLRLWGCRGVSAMCAALGRGVEA